MNGAQDDFEGGEQGDYGLDLFTEQDLVDRLVQAVTDDDLYQVLFWIKRLEEKGWIENINDGREFLISRIERAAS
jgi:predicted transcriptional regulator